jgi:hypothetical protein
VIIAWQKDWKIIRISSDHPPVFALDGYSPDVCWSLRSLSTFSSSSSILMTSLTSAFTKTAKIKAQNKMMAHALPYEKMSTET